MGRLKGALRKQLSPVAVRALNTLMRRPKIYSDPYIDWDSASAASRGYADPVILDHVHRAAHQVIRGEAAYERDSKTFDCSQYNWSLLASLLLLRLETEDDLHVLDFGGSLGSTFFQNTNLLSRIPNLHWTVIEQPHFVDVARKLISEPNLEFRDDFLAYIHLVVPQLTYFGSSIQYTPNPHEILDAVTQAGSQILVVDRTPTLDSDDDVIVVQQVPESIYPSSYPSWLFSRSKMRKYLGQHWQVISETSDEESAVWTESGWRVSWTTWICEAVNRSE